MQVLRRTLCTAVLVLGLLGSWFGAINLLRIASVWRDHIRGAHIEKGPLIIPREKLEALSKDNLIALLGASKAVLGSEYHFSLTGYTDVLVTGAVGFVSTVILTAGVLCRIGFRRRSG